MGCDDDDRNSLPRDCTRHDPEDHHPIAPAFRREVIPIPGAHYRGIGATASEPRGDLVTQCRAPNVVSSARCLQKKCRGISYARWYPPIERTFRSCAHLATLG